MISAMNTRSVSPVLVSACPHPSGVNVTSPALPGGFFHCRHIALSGQDVIRLTFSMMFMVTKGTSWLQESLPRKARTFHSALFSENMLDQHMPLSTAHCFHSFCVHSYHLVWIFLLLLYCITRQIPRLQNQNVTFSRIHNGSCRCL